MVNILIELLNEIKPISKPASDYLESIISFSEKTKGTKLLIEGEISNKIFFVVNGLMRSFYYENETEVTAWLAAENDFIYSPSSFILEKPSVETVELLENSTFLIFHKKDLEQLYLLFPEMAFISLRINQKNFLILEERVKILRLSAEKRLSQFELNNPKIKGRIKMDHLATYLGLSRSSVQSIKNKSYFDNKIKPEPRLNNQIEYSHFQ